MQQPIPNAATRVSLLVALILVALWAFAFTERERSVALLQWSGSILGLAALLPIPIAAVAVLLGWNLKLFAPWYGSLFVIMMGLAGLALLGIANEPGPPNPLFIVTSGIWWVETTFLAALFCVYNFAQYFSLLVSKERGQTPAASASDVNT